MRRERGCSEGSGLALTEMALVAGWRRSPPPATPLPWAPSAVPSPKVTVICKLLTTACNSPCSDAAANQTPPLGMRFRGAAFEVPSRFDRVPTHRFFAWSTTLKVAFIKGVGETRAKKNKYPKTGNKYFK